MTAAPPTPAASPPPRVSVILPAHGRGHLLKRSVGSVLAQTFTDLELIVVDDASPEPLAPALADVKDPRLTVLRRPERGGGGAARNTGLAAARGSLVAFQDSDDEWRPTMLERQVAALDAAPADVGVVYCATLRDIDGKVRRYPRGDEPDLDGDLHAALLRRNFIPTPATLVRRSVLDEVGGFDPKMPRYQDWDLWVRVARRHRFLHLPEELLLQYEQADSISKDVGARLAARRRMLEQLRGDLRRHPSIRADHLAAVAGLLEQAGDAREARRMRWRAWRAAPWRGTLLKDAWARR